MFGKNKILKPQNHDGLNLEVQEIFATFQGEGPYVGYPAVFVRLGGCNLACEFCDTEFDSFATMKLAEILARVLELASGEEKIMIQREKLIEEGELENKSGSTIKLEKSFSKKIAKNLVVITGGEPMRQPIERLCQELIALGFMVQVETNGTLFRELPKEVKIICSPKNSDGKYHRIRADLLARIDAFKFIISATNSKYSDIADVGQVGAGIAVYLQPMDEYDAQKNHKNMAHTLDLARKYDARISLQMHKLLGIS